MNDIARLAAAALFLAPLAACSAPAPTQPAPLAGAKIGGPFALTDQNGRTVRDTAFAGRYRIVYFGYTFCPDVCPTDLQHLGAGLKLFEKSDPARAARVVPIFISVDPARDTPAVLKPYVAAFHPRLVGLTGSPGAIAAVAKAYAVYYQAQPPSAGGGYMVSHTQAAYLMGPDGAPIALLPAEGDPQGVADELGKWVK
jgi:protein SCO1/2